MKNLVFIVFILFSVFCFGQNMQGAWQLISYNGEDVTNREVIKIVQDNYFALGSKKLSDNSFLGAAGGEFEIKGEILTEVRDFDTYDSLKIGEAYAYKIDWLGKDKLKISRPEELKIWKRISTKKDVLTRNWVITGRERNGVMKTMQPGDRRTIKILSGGRFQWVAFNSATKQFYASGGGTYTAENGIYIENILFFSKDRSRVGAELQFKFEVIDGNWHHQGKSSKGDPIYEIWSPYELAYKK